MNEFENQFIRTENKNGSIGITPNGNVPMVPGCIYLVSELLKQSPKGSSNISLNYYSKDKEQIAILAAAAEYISQIMGHKDITIITPAIITCPTESDIKKIGQKYTMNL